MTGWKQMDKYHLRLGDWTIAKMALANGAKYALWEGKVALNFDRETLRFEETFSSRGYEE